MEEKELKIFEKDQEWYYSADGWFYDIGPFLTKEEAEKAVQEFLEVVSI